MLPWQGDGGGLVVDMRPAMRGMRGQEEQKKEDDEQEGDESAQQAQSGDGQDDGGDDEERALGVHRHAGAGQRGGEQPVDEADDLQHEAEDGDEDEGDEADDVIHFGYIVRPGRYRNQRGCD